ncbi:MAG TPA: peptidylprolyl isomerase, partial [Rhodothermales bacterium]|nr:peptidylprolyl isomerase [Rhodothermales bacterium]
MNKMREQTALVLWLLVAAFGGLWVLQDSGFFDAVTGARMPEIGLVNGVPIDREEYSGTLDQRLQTYEQQGMEITPAMRSQIEDEVFDELVANRLREQEMDRLGVEVSDAEVNDLFRGPNPAPLIRQFFSDGRGGVDRAALEEFVAAPENREAVLQIEDAVRRSRREAKLEAIITASARVSEAEVEAEYVRRSRRADVQYVALRYADATGEESPVSERDLRAYYDAHQDDFHRPQTAAVEYVVFPKTPTAQDSARVRQELQGLRAEFQRSADPAAFAREHYGEAAAYAPASGLDPTLGDAVYSNPTLGRVVGPVFAGGEVVLARIVGLRPATAPQGATSGESVHARHILFAPTDRARAEQIKGQIEGGRLTFAAAAQQFSIDESNKSLGGELGWFGRGRMVAPFEEAVFAAPTGTVIGPVETQFGWHLVQVLGRTNQDVELVRISRPLVGSFDRLLEQADDFRFLAEAEGRG